MALENFGHHLVECSPGSKWENKTGDKVIFPEHCSTVADLLSNHHYDVFIRYGYAASLVNGHLDEEYKFWKSFYESMQLKRVGNVKIEEFDYLIKSFEKFGFKNGDPIPVDKNYEILDGSHRLACAALFEEKPRVAIYDHQSHSYKKEWFQEKGFSEEEIEKADEVRDFLSKKYSNTIAGSYVAIIWGSALKYWDEILASIDKRFVRHAFIKDYGKEIEDFIKISYLGDGMSGERIDAKAKKLSQVSSSSGIVVLDNSGEEMTAFKNKVRDELRSKIENYFFDCIIHTIDNQEYGEAFFSRYNVKNI